MNICFDRYFQRPINNLPQHKIKRNIPTNFQQSLRIPFLLPIPPIPTPIKLITPHSEKPPRNNFSLPPTTILISM